MIIDERGTMTTGPVLYLCQAMQLQAPERETIPNYTVIPTSEICATRSLPVRIFSQYTNNCRTFSAVTYFLVLLY